MHSLREILDAVFYMVRSGCAWRLLPHDEFPPWKTVHHYFRTCWRIDGTWERLHDALRERLRGRSSDGIHSRAPAWWIASRSRAPAWGENSEDTMAARR